MSETAELRKLTEVELDTMLARAWGETFGVELPARLRASLLGPKVKINSPVSGLFKKS